MSVIAKDGNNAEKLFIKSIKVRELLEDYFGKSIVSMSIIHGRKKSDILITFNDLTTERIQHKHGKGNSRGWSCDRRSIDKFPIDSIGKTLLTNVCIERKTSDRPTVAIHNTLIEELLLGTDITEMPTYFVHTVFNKKTGDLIELSICRSTTLISFLKTLSYTYFTPKRTCVHLNPFMYLQRKGGQKTDKFPNDIQLKLKTFPSEIMNHLIVL